MTAAAAASVGPTPEAIDQLCTEYSALKEKLLTAQLRMAEIGIELDRKAEALRSLVGERGSAHAEKSKILHGVKQEIVVSYGQSVSVDAAAVEKFRLALVKENKARLLKTLFEKTVRWTLQPQASDLVRGSKLSDKLRSLAAQCWITKAQTPRVQVREKK